MSQDRTADKVPHSSPGPRPDAAPEPAPGWVRDPPIERLVRGTLDYLAHHALVLDDLCLGLPISWAMVRDPAGRRAMGTALTPVPEGGLGGPLHLGLPPEWPDWPLSELPPRLLSDRPPERCLALAIVNAISQYRLAREGLAGLTTGQDRPGLVDWVVRQSPRRVVMIGNMEPIAQGLAAAGIPHRVFERNPGHRTGALSDAQEWAWLPQADGLIVTGATLVNHTLSPILGLARQAGFRVLVGFSAQAHPELLAGCGATHVFSVHIRDCDRVRRQLQAGHWSRMFDTETGYLAPLRPDP